MITLDEYVGPWAASPDLTPERRANAHALLLPATWALEKVMREAGIVFRDNPSTGSGISGKTLGGFRPQDCTIGAARSNHKEGLAVDRYDPAGEIDAWCLNNLDALARCGIWIEAPAKTIGWSHWQCVPPRSGNRVFLP
jgi:hypothetical protein